MLLHNMKKYMLLLCLILNGCAAYNNSSLTPDGFNYTLSRDRQSGDLTDYVGFTWSLKSK